MTVNNYSISYTLKAIINLTVPSELLEECINLVRENIKQGKEIQNIGGYLSSVINNKMNSDSQNAIRDEILSEKNTEDMIRVNLVKRWDEIDNFLQERSTTLQDLFNKFCSGEQGLSEDQYIKYLEIREFYYENIDLHGYARVLGEILLTNQTDYTQPVNLTFSVLRNIISFIDN